MSMPGSFFFTLLIFSAITRIYSVPGGVFGKLPKSPKSPERVESQVTWIEFIREYNPHVNENEASKNIQKKSAADNSETISKPVNANPDEKGYIHPDIMRPSGSNPSDNFQKKFQIVGPNPFENSLSSFDSLEKPKLKTRPSVKFASSIESISGEIVVPDMITFSKSFDDPFVTIDVPEMLKNDPKLYEEWLFVNLPERGYYQELNKKGQNEGVPVKMVESTRTMIMKRNPSKYEFVAPEQILVGTGSEIWRLIDLPRKAKKNAEKYQKWLLKNLPENGRYQEVYPSGLIVGVYNSESLKSAENKKNGGSLEFKAKTFQRSKTVFSRLSDKLNFRIEGGKKYSALKREDSDNSRINEGASTSGQ